MAAGAVLLGVALAASVALALRHLGAARLPGCALDSPCERALSGPYGTLPVADWPVAFAGVAWFGGLFAAWLAARGGWPRGLAWLARGGALASLAFVALAVRSDALCPFCLTAQGANLAFVAVSEVAARRARSARARAPELAFVAVALLATAGLGLARSAGERGRLAADERALAESTRAIEAGGDAPGRPAGFTGRYRRGPERAPLRLVLFTDYQCSDCARVEGEAWSLAEARTDLSLSIKHFPLCSACNSRARALGVNPHPNACWAARAAEAAGMLEGEAGFWRMHRWLFERGGAFTEAELARGLAELRFPAEPFLAAMHGAEALARVEADVAEGIGLGIQSTPMVFLNGVELRGWRAPDALRRAVEALAASAPETRGPEADSPQDALAKALEDWRLEPRVALPPRAGVAAAGAPALVLWGDYLDPTTRELDARIRAARGARPGLGYAFRHYPLDPECVPGVPARNPGACRAARAAEAVRLAGGPEAFARFHAALMDAPRPPDDAALRAAAAVLGLDLDALLASAEAASAVRADVAAARAVGIHAVPLLYLDGKRVPRWRLDGVDLLEKLLSEAEAGPR